MLKNTKTISNAKFSKKRCLIMENTQQAGYDKNSKNHDGFPHDTNENRRTEKIMKNNCTLCNKEIYCPDSAMPLKRRLCYECYEKTEKDLTDKELEEIYVDMPIEKTVSMTARNLSNMIVKDMFPLVWSERKYAMKDKSKKEASGEMFMIGAYFAIRIMLQQQIEDSENMCDGKCEECELYEDECNASKNIKREKDKTPDHNQ